jgi:hypothetical protein
VSAWSNVLNAETAFPLGWLDKERVLIVGAFFSMLPDQKYSRIKDT